MPVPEKKLALRLGSVSARKIPALKFVDQGEVLVLCPARGEKNFRDRKVVEQRHETAGDEWL